MHAAPPISMQELDSRVTDGIHVRLLWNPQDDRVSVAVLDMKTGDSFHIGVRRGERALDVFRHPYAYAALHGVTTVSTRISVAVAA
ncbi:MAG TPA: hypothetical protein VFN44_06490 [Solirubrobacteraceae bacterium]|nr:hypothetical protein [Solirubrobacteraceae bacterium]